jgi:hypothetical protein
MQVEISDGRPALFHCFQRSLDLMRQVPARRIRKPDAHHWNAGISPLLVHAIEHAHQFFRRDLAGPVGAKGVADRHPAFFRAACNSLLDLLWPRRDLLRLRAVRVALRENVAHVDAGRVLVRFRRQRRREFLRALETFVVQRGVGVSNARFGMKRFDELVHARHLRRPFGAYERAHRDFL